MRIATSKVPDGRWALSVGGVLVDEGGLYSVVWAVQEVSLVAVPFHSRCLSYHSFDRRVAVPAGGIVTIEFGLPK